MEHRMNSMEEDMLKMEMDETLKQAEAALDQIQKSSRKKKRVWIVSLRRRRKRCLHAAPHS